MVALLWLLACPAADPGDTAMPEMDATALLTRASLDLRGVRPTVDELEAVEADPAAVESLIDDFLLDERFGARIRDLYAEVFLTRTETWPISAAAYGLDDESAFEEALGEEVLRIVSHVATEDLPYTELVTGDWTMAEQNLGAAWPLDYPDGAAGWEVASYTDGRPAAGVLATNSFHWRYDSTTSNANRKRANQVSRIFLCNDYLVRPIEFDRNIDLLDEEAVLDALSTNPACLNCHVSLDPVASAFFGFFYYDEDSVLDATTYHPEREQQWRNYTEREPGYYGTTISGLSQLGTSLAADPRFVSCAVEQAHGLLLHRDMEAALDQNDLNAHREAFIDGGLTIRSLFRSLIDDPDYRAGLTDAESAVPLKMATPDLLETQIADLTGFTWTFDDVPLMRTDAVGLRTLAGGADGFTVTQVAREPNATTLLVQARLAQAAATYAVGEAAAGSHPLFTEVDVTDPSADPTDQLVHLHRVIFGNIVDPDGPEVAANAELYQSILAVSDDPEVAWSAVLTALLSDPDVLFY